MANLYLLDVWRTLIIPARQYHLLILPRPIDFGVAILNVLGFAVVMYIALALARQWIGEKAASTLALLYLSLLFLSRTEPLNEARVSVASPFSLGP